MRRVILLVWGSLLLFSATASYADLGDIKVKSYLSQRFDAAIPLTNMSKDVDYNNLHFGLASGSKFKEYGIDFNPELGSFNFKIVTSSANPYVIITSSKPINSPVLNFLLHYKINKDDFYRQYTVLLDPVDYSSTSTKSNQDKKIVVRGINNDFNYDGEVRQKPIPIYTRTGTSSSISKVSYQMDLTNPLIQASLKKFNRESMSYVTESGDSLYNIARFSQLLYSKAQFSINQIMIALGMENYRTMHDSEFLYESAIQVRIPTADRINTVSASLADEYLLDTNLNNDQKIGILKAIAAKYSSAIVIEPQSLFVAKPQLLKKEPKLSNASLPVIVRAKHTPASVVQDEGIITLILDKILWLLVIVVIILTLVVIKKRYPDLSFKKLKYILARNWINNKTKQNKIDPDSPEAAYETLNKFSHHRNLIQQFESLEEQPFNVNAEANKDLAPKDVENTVDLAVSGVSDEKALLDNENYERQNSIDQDLVSTLERILLMDSSRNDIRYKLFELYLVGGIKNSASEIYYALDKNLDIEDPLRHNIELLCQRYEFIPLPEDEISSSVMETKPAMVKEPEYKYDTPLMEAIPDIATDIKTEDSLDADHVVDFVSFTPTDIVPDPEEVVNFSQERMLDFSVVDYKPVVEPEQSINNDEAITETVNTSVEDLLVKTAPPLTIEHGEFDEKINLAKMYFHIEEPDKAREIINALLAIGTIPDSVREEIDKLKAEMGING